MASSVRKCYRKDWAVSFKMRWDTWINYTSEMSTFDVQYVVDTPPD